MIFHPDYASPLPDPVNNVIIQSKDGTAFYFDSDSLKSASSFFKDLTTLPKLFSASSTASASYGIFPLPSTSTKAVHLIRRLTAVNRLIPHETTVLDPFDYNDPDLDSTIRQVFSFADAFDAGDLMRRIAQRLKGEPFLQLALSVGVQDWLVNGRSQDLVKNYRLSDMPAVARLILADYHPETLQLLERLYKTRDDDYQWDDIKASILATKVFIQGYSVQRNRCPVHADWRNPLSAQAYNELRPTLVATLKPEDLHTKASLKRVIYATLGCKTDACFQPIYRALKRRGLPIPQTIGDLRERDEKAAKLQARGKAGKDARAEWNKATKRKREDEDEEVEVDGMEVKGAY